MTDADRLREIYRYDPETGLFTWKKCRRSDFLGKEAGCADLNSRVAYRIMRFDGRAHLAHRLAWLYMTGQWPAAIIDHRDGNGLNNSWGNIRAATAADNQRNRGRNANNTSGFKGVTLNKKLGKFVAQITAGGEVVYLGLFQTPEAAHAAYSRAAAELHGDFARVA